jgi:mannose-1-phosphate guanylyltransferase
MYVVILAGGGGTRLRPMSRDDRPKPFLPLLGERTLIQQTVDRLRGLVAPRDIHVVTDRRYTDLVRAQVPGIDVIEEPVGRNTAAAIALATLAIDRPEDQVMVVLPADHAITEPGIFKGVIESAARHLARGSFGIVDPLVTLGIQIDRPAVEYGYLRPDIDRGENVDGMQAYPLQGFEEKPTAERAAELFVEGTGVAWNAGMFLWKRRAIRDALAAYTPLLSALAPAVRSHDAAALARAYERLPSISIDYAVMEPAARDGRVVMAAMDIGWSDIGGWTALIAQCGGSCSGRVIQPGEPADLAADDLAIVWDGIRLAIHDGPGTIRSDNPIAHLVGAAVDRERVHELVARVAALEAHQA